MFLIWPCRALEGAKVITVLRLVPLLLPGCEGLVFFGTEGGDGGDDCFIVEYGEEDDGVNGGFFGKVAARDEVGIVLRRICVVMS